tara:strand:- start:209 stop:460 length:252 start_codon:yes stop_codon:yes gene_type:complete
MKKLLLAFSLIAIFGIGITTASVTLPDDNTTVENSDIDGDGDKKKKKSKNTACCKKETTTKSCCSKNANKEEKSSCSKKQSKS